MLQPAPDGLLLEADEIHLWHLSLAAFSGNDLAALLSEEERARAARFRFPIHRRQYIVARGMLRTLLGRYLDSPPEAIALRYNRFGKPFLRDDALQFNVSHADDVAVMVFTRDDRVGVDVERVRADIMDENIAAHFFAPREVAALDAVAPEEQPGAFFRCWTRKEAFIKAIGHGLSLPLNAFTVSLDPTAPALLETAWNPLEASRWTLHTFHPTAGYAGALAVEGKNHSILDFRF